MNIKEFAKKYKLTKDDVWDCHKNWILTHDAVTKIGTMENIVLEKIESIYQSETMCRFLVTMSKGDMTITSVGEASKTNSKNIYFGCMAEKRGVDRCILKLINAYEYGVYSVVEADDFERNQDITPEQENKILKGELKEARDKADAEHPLANTIKKTMETKTIDDSGDVISFGKHKGTKWSDVDESYLKWVAKNLDKHKDIAQKHLDARQGKIVEEFEDEVPF